MSALLPGRPATLEWGIRSSLIAYMSRDPHFAVEATGGATYSVADGLRMTGRSDASGALRFDGSVILRAHEGALTLPLSDVELSPTALTIDDPAADPDQPGRLTLVHLDEVDGAAPGTAVFTTRLAAGADALFMFNYIPDSPFDPLRIRFGAV